jgi:excisionase family DNA binding protein
VVERLAYTPAEVCEALRVGRTKLYELIAERKFKALALGGKTIIPCAEVEQFLSSLPSIQLRADKGARRDVAPSDETPGPAWQHRSFGPPRIIHARPAVRLVALASRLSRFCICKGAQAMIASQNEIARALGGRVVRGQVLAPGPGHSKADRSLSVKLSPGSPDGFVVHSFAGDDWTTCRDHVRLALGHRFCPRQPARPSSRPQSESGVLGYDASRRSDLALRIWQEAF